MKGLFLTSYGLNIRRNVAFLEREVEAPQPNDLLIEVYAAGLNPVDYKFIYGMAIILINPKRPFPLGFDLAGKVIGKGDQVQDFEIGDEVYTKVPWDQMGAISTNILVRENMVALKPTNANFNEAAGLPLVGCTVLDSFEFAKVNQSTRLLIIGGSGGTGTFAIQYAKYLGAHVSTITSTPNVEWVKSLGADQVIDYKKEDFRKILKEVDVVFDTVGGLYPWKSANVVKKGGKIISIAGHHDDDTLKEVGVFWLFRLAFWLKGVPLMWRMRRKKILYKHVWSYPNQEKLIKIAKLVEAKKIKPIVDRVYDFKDAIEGLIYLKRNRAKGKVIVRMKE